MNKKKIVFFIAAAALCLPLAFIGNGSKKDGSRVVRAALDIGSGATKLKVAEIDLKTNKIEKVLANESYSVQYQEALEKSSDQNFDEETMKTGIAALQKSVEVAKSYNADKVVAVATASFRKGKNVQEFIDRIWRETGVKVHIIDQNLEGILGFQAAAAQMDADPKSVVIWDIGGGSYQFSTLDEKGNIAVHRGIEASIPFKNHVIKSIQKKDPSSIGTPNPLKKEEMLQAKSHAWKISEKVDALFRKKINAPDTHVVGIGNIFAYRIHPLVGKKSTFTQKELHEQVQGLAGMTDKDLGGGEYVKVAVTDPVMILGFMEKLGIEKMEIADVNNADGALLYSAFWDKEEQTAKA